MDLLEQPSDAAQLIAEDEVHFDASPELTGALKIVIQDFESSEKWLSSKEWSLRWKESQARYEPARIWNTWENTTVPRSSLNVFTVGQVVQSLNAKVIEGIFSDDPPFVASPRRGTDAEEARAVTALIQYQLEDCDFRQEVTNGIADAILFGTAIWKANWKETKKISRTYHRKKSPTELPATIPGASPQFVHTAESDELVVDEREVEKGAPILELQDLNCTYVSPGCRHPDIRKSKYVISKINVSAEELNEMRGWEGYDIPPESELMDILFPKEEGVDPSLMESKQASGSLNFTHQAQPRWISDTEDPLDDSARFEILERWDNGRVMAVLNRKLVIRDEEHSFNSVPYFSVGWWRVPNSFYSIGVGILAGDEQEVQRGVINAMMDQLNWNVNLPILRVKGDNSQTENIRMSLGKFVDVDDVDKSMKQMERMQAIPEAYAEIQASQARVEASTGANELLVQGSMPSQGRTSIGRTATGANLLAGGSGSRLEAFVERVATQVIVPALDMFLEMDKQLLEIDQLREIIDEEMFNAYQRDHVKILNANVRFDVLAASRMTSRQKMAQSLPMFAQTLLTDPMHQMMQSQGMKLDVNELLNMWFDIVGWKNKSSLIVPMTADDEQRLASNNPALQKMAVDKAKQQGQTDSKLQVLDSENAARAYREINRQVIQMALKSQEETGVANPNGLGS